MVSGTQDVGGVECVGVVSFQVERDHDIVLNHRSIISNTLIYLR